MAAQHAAHAEPVSAGPCRFCGAPLTESVLDLGYQPPANRYPEAEDLGRPEPAFPLHLFVCGGCFLVQIQDFQTPEDLFTEYAYFSSYAESWLRHAEAYCGQAISRFGLDGASRVVEIASNDGYLLQFFERRDIPVMGIEPAANVARVAEQRGIPTIVRFFGLELARELAESDLRADLLVGNNVFAHVPDINDFAAGLKIALAPDGVLTLEFPHLLRLLAETQFDTIYHEHFSYFSLLAAERILNRHGLPVFDVEELPTHGGSLRIYATHAELARPVGHRVQCVRSLERDFGLEGLDVYQRFARATDDVRRGLRGFFDEARRMGKIVAGYGAPAKGNTLLNYCGVGPADLAYTVDRNPHKQDRLLPGTHVPIHHPDRIRETRPDYVLILPWNLKDEIMEQMAFIRDWGGCFVVPIPEVRILP